MKINNDTIEKIFTVLNNPSSFRNNVNVKVPANIRYAIRINEKRLFEFYDAYIKERKSIIEAHIAQHHAAIENNEICIFPEYMKQVQGELTDLASVENDADLYLVDASVMDQFLSATDLSIPEEQLLLLFTKPNT